MRITRCKIENFRGVASHEVHFGPGVTVVQGDNEVGKSSLAEAIDLCFEMPDSSNSGRVRAVRPVGRDVGTLIELDVETGQYRFTYRKRFGRDRFTELRVHAPRVESHAGREAHDRVEAILTQTVDVALWRALRLHQGTAIDQADLSTQTSLAKALDVTAAQHDDPSAADDLFTVVTGEYHQYFTPKRGEPLAESRRLADAVAQARDELSEVDAELVAVAELAARVERLDTRAGEGRRALAEQRIQVAELRQRAAGAQAHARQLELLDAELATARASLRAARERADGRSRLAERERAARERLLAAEAELEQAESAAARGSAAATQAADAAKRGEHELELARTAQALSRSDVDYLRDAEEVASLTGRLRRHDEARARVAEAAAVRESVAVTASALRRLEEAHLRWRQFEARLGDDLPRVRVEGAGAVVAAGDDERESGTEPVTVAVSGPVSVRVGAIRVTVTPGRGAEELREAEREALRAYEAECAALRVTDISHARAEAERRQDAERAHDDAERDVAEALGGLDVATCHARLTAAQARVRSYLDARAEGARDLPSDVDAAREALAEADAALDARERDHEHTRSRAEQARGTAEATRDAAVAAQAQCEAVREELRRVRAELESAELGTDDERARGEEDLAALRARRDTLAAEAGQPDADQIAIEWENTELVLAQTDTALRTDETTLAALRAELAVRGGTGLAERRGTLHRRLERAERELAAYTARADAAKLLYETMAAARRDARHAYVEPLRARIEGLARVVFGPDTGIEVAEDLRVSARILAGERVEFAHLSGGAREQLAIVSRLACASLVSAAGGVPVILDDALGYSDPERVRRMGAVLAHAGKQCQVIVLTCVPERYRAVGGATVVELAATP